MDFKFVLGLPHCKNLMVNILKSISTLSFHKADKDQRKAILLEAAAVKFVNRQTHLQKSRQEEGTIPRDDVLISLLADLQQEQDKESEVVIGTMQDKVSTYSSYAIRNLLDKTFQVQFCKFLQLRIR